MGTERIKLLVDTHRGKFEKMISKALATRWVAWSTQAAELQIFHTDQENHRRKETKGFYKLDEESITTIHEELTNDYYSLAQFHSMEIQKLLDEFEDDQLQLALELEDVWKGMNSGGRRIGGKEGGSTYRSTRQRSKQASP